MLGCDSYDVARGHAKKCWRAPLARSASRQMVARRERTTVIMGDDVRDGTVVGVVVTVS